MGDHVNLASRLEGLNKWEKAFDLFSALNETYPKDGPTQIYVERSRLFMANPPPHEWDGVFEATTK